MIEPFSAAQVAEGTISYGLSSYGYDLRLADEFKIFTAPRDGVLNPKSIPPEWTSFREDARVPPYSSRCPDTLRGQIHVRARRGTGERHAF